MDIVGLYVFAYLIGAFPTAYLIGKTIKGVDIRVYGSGNVGGANVFYHVGKKWAIFLGVFEILVKGAGPVCFGHYVMGLDRSSALLLVAPLLAVMGHNWSVFLKFQGGRGIAVGIGTLLALSPLLFVGFFVVAFGGWALTRSSGVWVLVALTLTPVWAFLIGEPAAISYFCLGLVTLTVSKRLLSNWTPLPEGLPAGKVLFNRLFRDRDVDDRAEWVHRVPQATK